MRERDFELYLGAEPTISSDKAVASRMAKARKAEVLLGESLDVVVSNDDTMYEALCSLRLQEDPAHTPMQNAVRKYYKFVHGREFPQLKDYHSPKHP